MQVEVYIYIFFQMAYMHLNDLYIWLHIAIYTHTCTILVPERHMRPIHSTFTARKHGTHYKGTVQRYPTSLQRAVAPTELPGHSDNQLRLSYIQVTKQA